MSLAVANPSPLSPTEELRLSARVPDPRRRPVMRQTWDSLLFLHWRIAPEFIQQTLPAGLFVDTYHGAAFVGVVPFFMRAVRPTIAPPVPWLSYFLELNVRTYVHDRAGNPGVWFYSLDCSQPAAVWIARRFFGLPYFHARMSATRGEWIDYASTRRLTNEEARYRYRAGGEARTAAVGSLEFFLLERYFLFSGGSGALRRGQVAHPPYAYRDAEVDALSTLPLKLAGLGDFAETPEHVCAVDQLPVKIFALESVE